MPSILGLFAILLLVLLLPFLVKKVEENLEIFLFAMGALAVTVTSQWAWPLVQEGLVEPIKITAAVLVAGLLFKFLRAAARKAVGAATAALGPKAFSFALVLVLGLVSSVITAIIAALLLVEVIDCMKLDRKDEIRIVVVACFAIGLGAVLTPLGEPLATIVIAKLQGRAVQRVLLVPVLRILALCRARSPRLRHPCGHHRQKGRTGEGLREDRAETFRDVLLRTAKTYLFVMALVFLGAGFKPIIDMFISKVPATGLFWLNSISAILDNATLAAAEVGASMSSPQLDYALLGPHHRGRHPHPGEHPEHHFGREAQNQEQGMDGRGLPIGAVAMAVYFIALLVFARYDSNA